MASIMWCCLFSVLFYLSFSINVIESKSGLENLNEDNWDLMLSGEWMVEL